MYKVTDKIRADVRQRMLEEGYTPGTVMRLFFCPHCGSYAWSQGTGSGLICLSCDTDSEEPELMEEEEIIL